MKRAFVLTLDLPASYNHIRNFQNFHYHPRFLIWSQILFQTKSLNIFQTYLGVQEQGTYYKSIIWSKK